MNTKNKCKKKKVAKKCKETCKKCCPGDTVIDEVGHCSCPGDTVNDGLGTCSCPENTMNDGDGNCIPTNPGGKCCETAKVKFKQFKSVITSVSIYF